MSRQKLEFEVLRSAVAEAPYAMYDILGSVDKFGATSEIFRTPGYALAWEAVLDAKRKGEFSTARVWAALQGVSVQDIERIMFDSSGAPGFAKTLQALIVLDKKVRLSEGLNKTISDAKRPDATVDSIVTGLIDLAEQAGFSRTTKTSDDYLQELGREIDLNAKGASLTVPTGIAPLDRVIGGLQPTLTILGAESGKGKSALAAGIIRNLAMRGVKVGLISLEDEATWIFRRFLAYETGIPVMVLQSRKLTMDQQARAQEAMASCSGWMRNVICRDRTPMDAKEVVAEMHSLITEGCKAIFLDHIGEVAIDRSVRFDLDLSDILRKIRNLAKYARIPLVVISHLKRRQGMTEPSLTDFAESAGLERQSRVALGLWRDERGATFCTVLKCTNGVAGVTIGLNFHGSSSLILSSAVPDGLESKMRKTYHDKDDE